MIRSSEAGVLLDSLGASYDTCVFLKGIQGVDLGPETTADEVPRESDFNEDHIGRSQARPWTRWRTRHHTGRPHGGERVQYPPVDPGSGKERADAILTEGEGAHPNDKEIVNCKSFCACGITSGAMSFSGH